MTAEERRAYAYAHRNGKPIPYRNIKTVSAKEKVKTEYKLLSWKFLIAMILFVAFLSLDYTGYRIHGIGSSEIIGEVMRNSEISFEFYKNL